MEQWTPWQRIGDALAEMIRGPHYQTKIRQWWPDDGEKPGLTTTMTFRAKSRAAAVQEATREAWRGAVPGFSRVDIEVTGP